MELFNNVMAQLLLIVVAALLSLIIFFSLSRKTLIYMAVLYSVFFLSCFLEIVDKSSIIINKLHFVIYTPRTLSILPLIYLYVLNLNRYKPFFSFRNYGHLLPAFVFMLLFSKIFIESFTESKAAIEYIDKVYNYEVPYYKYVSYVFWEGLQRIQVVVYIVLIFKEIKKYKIRLRNEFSEVDRKSLIWIKYLLVYIVVAGILFFSFYFFFDFGKYVNMIIHKIFFISLLIYMGYHAIRQKEEYAILAEHDKKYIVKIPVEKNDEKQENVKSIEAKSQVSMLDDELSKKVLQKLVDLMKEEKLYTKPGVTLNDISEKIDASKQNISAVINNELDMNFYKYINSLRIEEACVLLKDPAYVNHTIEGVAIEVGFKSKSSFNQAFKNIVGKTPSEFRDTKN